MGGKPCSFVALGYAVSRDGILWQDHAGPPLIQPGEPYDRGYCQAPTVIYDPESQSYLVYYNGATSGDPEKERVTINLAIFRRDELVGLPLKPAP